MLWSVVLEKTLESPLDCKEIQPVHSEGDEPWDFFGRNDAKAETPVLCPSHLKSWLIGKDSGAGRDWGQEEKGTTEDEMAGWHHSLDGRGSGWTPGVGDGQGGLACCDSWGCRVRHNWATDLIWSDRMRNDPLVGEEETGCSLEEVWYLSWFHIRSTFGDTGDSESVIGTHLCYLWKMTHTTNTSFSTLIIECNATFHLKAYRIIKSYLFTIQVHGLSFRVVNHQSRSRAMGSFVDWSLASSSFSLWFWGEGCLSYAHKSH